MTKPQKSGAAIDLTTYDIDDEDAWNVLDELEGNVSVKKSPSPTKKKWLPDGMEPVLEELPKWNLLADILQEIEEEMTRRAGTLDPC